MTPFADRASAASSGDGPPPFADRALHLIGVGGAGMSGYARVCAQLGARVSGSDRADSPALAHLRALGVTTHVGHDAANVPPDAEVVYSSAVPQENPERAIARERGQRELPRAELLHELSGLKRCLSIAGAHGKTTTTSMAAHVLLRCGLAPSYLVGGALRTTGEHADWGTGDWLVVEADESDRSFLRLQTDVGVVLNVEHDHHATYASLADVEAVFAEFVAGAGTALVWDGVTGRVPGERFAAPDARLEPGGSTFAWRGHEVRLAVPGAHNALNALAALEACRLAGADEADAAAALADFAGAGRRFERLGHHRSGALVVDDYAHHPTEVAATVAAARTLEHDRLVAVFQPHLFSRTAELHEGFAEALRGADVAVVCGIYPARERAEDFPGVTGDLIAAGVPGATSAPDLDAAFAVLDEALRPGDLCLVMGAGDVDALGRRLVAGAAA